MMFTTSKRPRPTMRYPPHKSEPCLVEHRSRSAYFADRLFLAISRSPSIFLFLSVFLADMCVFQVMSINKSMSSNKKLLSLVKLVKLSRFLAFKNATLQKIFRAPPRTPLGGSTPPRPPPAKHLHSPLATLLLLYMYRNELFTVHVWLRLCDLLHRFSALVFFSFVFVSSVVYPKSATFFFV